ncbi:caspase family protein [Mycobacterium sp. 360MFTsu5.1]|uniref:caspase family protein n=1 Tax=Mycobacterium sp. 360MFTsu5.1 TaxID=1172186 RepID=UPI0012DF97E1|nr:caspase family protein [Mycobacterium sp. 360MFTsu5.1]
MNRYHYAIGVGITNYPNYSSLKALAGPVNDANAFRDWLENEGGVPVKNIEQLTTPIGAPTPGAAQPVKGQLDDAMERLHDKIEADTAHDPALWHQSRLYVFLAGHGIIPRGGESALLLANTRQGRHENFEVSQYVNWYHYHGGIFKEIVFFTDCCRNRFDKTPPSVPPFDLTDGTCPTVFTMGGYACAPGTPAYDQKEAQTPANERRGYFTQALLRGLRGGAQIDLAEGVITGQTLATYVQFAVRHTTSHKPIPQHVTTPTSDQGYPIRFGAPTTIPMNQATISIPPAFAREVELRDPTGKRHKWANGPTPWPMTGPDGLYGVVEVSTMSGSAFQDDGRFAVIGDTHVQL